jgi:flavin-dependent dehydrogenase
MAMKIGVHQSSGTQRFSPTRRPVAIFSRHVLNELMLARARSAGAELVQERVIAVQGDPGNWQLTIRSGQVKASYLVLAAGGVVVSARSLRRLTRLTILWQLLALHSRQ